MTVGSTGQKPTGSGVCDPEKVEDLANLVVPIPAIVAHIR
jgi:hypothetical protein